MKSLINTLFVISAVGLAIGITYKVTKSDTPVAATVAIVAPAVNNDVANSRPVNAADIAEAAEKAGDPAALAALAEREAETDRIVAQRTAQEKLSWFAINVTAGNATKVCEPIDIGVFADTMSKSGLWNMEKLEKHVPWKTGSLDFTVHYSMFADSSKKVDVRFVRGFEQCKQAYKEMNSK